MTVRYFYDCEFLEDGQTIDLISIGIACEDGREYYAINGDAPWDRIKQHDWLMANVVPHLALTSNNDVKAHQRIANEVRDFLLCDLPEGTDVELWADYGAYDHVALAQLWGPMIRLPKGIPMFTNDIQTYAKLAGVSHKHLPLTAGTEHHALADARNVWDRYVFIREAQKVRTR